MSRVASISLQFTSDLTEARARYEEFVKKVESTPVKIPLVTPEGQKATPENVATLASPGGVPSGGASAAASLKQTAAPPTVAAMPARTATDRLEAKSESAGRMTRRDPGDRIASYAYSPEEQIVIDALSSRQMGLPRARAAALLNAAVAQNPQFTTADELLPAAMQLHASGQPLQTLGPASMATIAPGQIAAAAVAQAQAQGNAGAQAVPPPLPPSGPTPPPVPSPGGQGTRGGGRPGGPLGLAYGGLARAATWGFVAREVLNVAGDYRDYNRDLTLARTSEDIIKADLKQRERLESIPFAGQLAGLLTDPTGSRRAGVERTLADVKFSEEQNELKMNYRRSRTALTRGYEVDLATRGVTQERAQVSVDYANSVDKIRQQRDEEIKNTSRPQLDESLTAINLKYDAMLPKFGQGYNLFLGNTTDSVEAQRSAAINIARSQYKSATDNIAGAYKPLEDAAAKKRDIELGLIDDRQRYESYKDRQSVTVSRLEAMGSSYAADTEKARGQFFADVQAADPTKRADATFNALARFNSFNAGRDRVLGLDRQRMGADNDATSLQQSGFDYAAALRKVQGDFLPIIKDGKVVGFQGMDKSATGYKQDLQLKTQAYQNAVAGAGIENQRQQIRNTATLSGLSAQLNDDPLGARVTEIRGERDAANVGLSFFSPRRAMNYAAAGMSEMVARRDFRRAAQMREYSQTGENANYQALLNDDPLGGQLGQLKQERQAALLQAKPGGGGQAERDRINTTYDLKEQFAKQQFANQRKLIDIGQDAGERSLDRYLARDPIGARAAEIAGSTIGEANRLKFGGFGEEAERAKRLGIKQLGLEKQNYLDAFEGRELDLRSIDITNPRDVTDPSAVMDQIAKEQQRISSSVPGSPAFNGGDLPKDEPGKMSKTLENIEALVKPLRDFLERLATGQQ